MLRTGAQQAGLALGVSHGGFTGMVRATAEALGAICEFDLSELWAIVPPRDFGLNSRALSSAQRHRRCAKGADPSYACLCMTGISRNQRPMRGRNCARKGGSELEAI